MAEPLAPASSVPDLVQQLYPMLHETELFLGLIAPKVGTPVAQTCVRYLGEIVSEALQVLERAQAHSPLPMVIGMLLHYAVT